MIRCAADNTDRSLMRKLLLAGLLCCSPFALAQDDAAKQDPARKARAQQESASGGASAPAAG